MEVNSKEYEDLLRAKIENVFLVEIIRLQKKLEMYKDAFIESEKEKRKLIDELEKLKGERYERGRIESAGDSMVES